jgi:pyrroline-5-carboxylate reductase
MKPLAITIVGGGNMGEALIKGLTGHALSVCEPNASRATYLKKKYKIRSLALREAMKDSRIVILAVKPQDMEAVLKDVTAPGKLFISIAAGLTIRFFETRISGRPRVVRCMPNMPALIAEAITGVCAGKYAMPADLKMARTILGAIGETVVVKESSMNALTAVSGSGPAYVFLFVEHWIRAARAVGFSQDQAKALVYKTLLGSAHLLEKSKLDAANLRARVTSKGGTTQAALNEFSKGKLDQVFKRALQAARKRAMQLAK